MNACSWLVNTISDSIHCSVAANQGKGTDSPAEKVTAKNEESPVSIYYLPHCCPTPQPSVFQRQVLVTWGLVLTVRRS